MEKGKNLEDIFLSSRMVGSDPDFPMISTAEGQNIQRLLYKLMTPYLFYNNKNFDDFKKIYNVNNLEKTVCTMKEENKQLNSILEQVEEMEKAPKMMLDISLLKKALQSYRTYQEKYEAILLGSKDAGVEVRFLLNRDYLIQKKLWDDTDAISFLNADYKKTEKVYREIYNDPSITDKKIWQDSINEIAAKKKISDEVRRKLSPLSKKKILALTDIIEKSGVTYSLASKVSLEARKVYAELYRKSMSKKSNPCRDFVL